MVDPPRVGRESQETMDLYNAQKDKVENGLAKRAKLLTETFNDMENVSC